MAKYFYFTRHGQTVWNVENKICGATDIALTDVRRILMETSRKLPGLEGKIQCGGVVNVYDAVNYGK